MHDYQPRPDLLAGRTILVTGAGDGLGRAASLAFARHGATVVLLGRTLAKLERVYDTIEAAGHPQPAIFPMDLASTSERDCQGLAETLERELGSLHGLLHNAADLPLLSRIDDYEAELWERVLKVNLTVPFLLTQACLPLLRQAEDASILFTSDRVGRRGLAYWGAYGVSKFGLEGLMQILAEETRDSTQIRVNSIDPGPARTSLRARVYPGENPDRVPPPESLMGLYLYLMGPDSAGVTGQALEVQPEVQA